MQALGLIAGGGGIPLKVHQEMARRGVRCYTLALKNQVTEEALGFKPDAWISLGRLGKAIRLLKKEKIEDIVMVGTLRRPSLTEFLLDAWTAKLAVKLTLGAFGDDALLRGVISSVEKEGFRVRGVHEFLPELLAPRGILGKHTPSPAARKDIVRGMEVAGALGSLDIGQAVVVQQGITLAVEGAEGTEKLIARTKDLSRKGEKGTLVKRKKPQQEERADLPTVGSKTVKQAAEAGLGGIAVEAGGVLIVDLEETVRQADRLGLFIVGVGPDGQF